MFAIMIVLKKVLLRALFESIIAVVPSLLFIYRRTYHESSHGSEWWVLFRYVNEYSFLHVCNSLIGVKWLCRWFGASGYSSILSVVHISPRFSHFVWLHGAFTCHQHLSGTLPKMIQGNYFSHCLFVCVYFTWFSHSLQRRDSVQATLLATK